MIRHYDLCVIGSGPAGQKAAVQASKLGKSVCVVERREVVGGVTVNTGTIPSKALREAILNNEKVRSVAAREADFASARNATFSGLLSAVDRVMRLEIETIEGHFRSNGIEVAHGKASFRDPHQVEVVSSESSRLVTADKFLISVGTVPARPEAIPFDGENIVTSDELLKMEKLPKSLIVVGGGVIGTEYASMLAALGVKITLVEARDSLLGFVDRELTEALQYHLRRAGVTLRLGEKVEKIELEEGNEQQSTDKRLVKATLASGKHLRSDALLYSIGRQGATSGLALDLAGLEADRRGRLTVDEYHRTSVEHVYAAGDVIGFPALASTSMDQGRLAACHMFDAPATSVPQQLPFGIYAIPEISMVGYTEDQLSEKGIPFESGVARYEEIARGQLLGDDVGMLKLLIHQDTRELLGVHALGTGATELIHLGQAVMVLGGKADYFVNNVFNYPTLAECYKVAAHNGLNKLACV
ncbi:MAG: Si-specific NAD(P)(+) transhydrogenase [Planctomycetota bacterium]